MTLIFYLWAKNTNIENGNVIFYGAAFGIMMDALLISILIYKIAETLQSLF